MLNGIARHGLCHDDLPMISATGCYGKVITFEGPVRQPQGSDQPASPVTQLCAEYREGEQQD